MRQPDIMASHWKRAVSVIAGVVCAGMLTARAAQAEPVRFLPWTGTKTPPLALNDLTGRPHTLADYRGKVVLVNFWATWCDPCIEEMPSMQKLKERFADLPFEVLAVNYGESEAKVSGFVKRLAVTFRVLLDPNREAPRAWRVRVLPTSFLIGTDGQVRYSVVGEADWAGDDAANIVRGLLP